MTQKTEHTSLSSGQDMRKKKKGFTFFSICVVVLIMFSFYAVRFTTTNNIININDSSSSSVDVDVTDDGNQNQDQVGGIRVTCPHGCTFYYFGCGTLGNPQLCDTCANFKDASTGDKALCLSAYPFGIYVASALGYCCK